MGFRLKGALKNTLNKVPQGAETGPHKNLKDLLVEAEGDIE
jgi:hypothetical protein